jgi:hypothetical protein
MQPGWVHEVTGADVFGALLAFSLSSRLWLSACVFSVALILVVAEGMLARCAHVRLHDDAVEGIGPRGWQRIHCRDIDRIPATDGPAPRLLSSADGRAIWLSSRLGGYERLLELIWQRVNVLHDRMADRELDPYQTHALGQLCGGSARDVVRGNGWLRGDIARRPLWLSLMRRHPLRGQYSAQRYLLDRGRIVIAHVVSGSAALFESPKHQRAYDVPALVVFAPQAIWHEGPRIAQEIQHLLFSDDNEHFGASATAQDVRRFRRLLTRNAGSPLLVPVPAAWCGTEGVFCTSMMVSPRHLPLGSLRSDWLPIVVDPERCPFAIVLPLRFWPATIRQVWKAGARFPSDAADHAGERDERISA